MRPPLRITAAIPAYNSERYLAEAIKSVLEQSHPVEECIVVDDGSTDATEDIVRSFEGVRYIRQNNGGDANARNRAIAEAHGDLIAFLDADDIWLTNKLEVQMQLFERRPGLGMVYSGVFEVDASLRTLDVLRAASGDVALRNTLLVEKPYMTGIGSTAVLPTDVAKKTGFDERLKASSDWAFACRVAVEYPVEGVPEPLALYRQHGSHQVHRNLTFVERDMKLVWEELFSSGDVPGLARYRRRAETNLHLSLAASSFEQGNRGAFLHHLARAITRRPDRVVAAFWRRYLGP